MSRRFTFVTVALTAVVAFLVGVIVAGSLGRPLVTADAPGRRAVPPAAKGAAGGHPALVSFADIVERLNPAIVNIDATSRAAERRRERPIVEVPDPLGPWRNRETPRRGTGSGFIIDADGSILTNHHVIERADRIVVTLSDGRTLRARVVGADPDTDIALIRVEGQQNLPVAPLGDSSTLRMGEWVCAIGNPLGYQHSVTVGVISHLGRKLFDASLDDYIQTDAAINFGNSGGPLINARGEVIGINAAISSRASNIGFAVPINGASAILPQLRASGRVSRGYIGVHLRDVDDDLRRSLGLPVGQGALVQDLTPGSPAERAGIKPYDVIVSFDNEPIASDDGLIRAIAGRTPGSTAPLRLVRDGREQTISVKLAERPLRATPSAAPPAQTPARDGRADLEPVLGLSVRDLDRFITDRMELPAATRGVLITRVEPLSASFDAELRRNTVLLEINRMPVGSAAEFRRIARTARPGDVLTLYVYSPEIGQRELKTIRVEGQ